MSTGIDRTTGGYSAREITSPDWGNVVFDPDGPVNYITWVLLRWIQQELGLTLRDDFGLQAWTPFRMVKVA